MATYSASVADRHSNDADFRLWGKAISDGFLALDPALKKTTDTGQINWDTATRPASTNTSAGHELYYLNDSLHGTTPIYIRVQYGASSASVNHSQIWVALGTGTNGSGSLTGTFGSTRTVLNDNFAGGTVARTFRMCAVSGCVWFAWDRASVNGSGMFSVFRTTDNSGALTNDGCGLIYASSTSKTIQASQFSPASNLTYAHFGMFCFPAFATSGASQVAGIFLGGLTYQRLTPFFVGAYDADAAVGSTFTATPVGASSRTFISLGGSSGGAAGFANITATTLCGVWE